MTIPYAEPLVPIEPCARVVPEPPRRGDDDAHPCGVCLGRTPAPVWEDEHFTVHPPRTCSLPGTVWVASRLHLDTLGDLPLAAQSAFGPLVARLERAILARGDVGRVHLYRWGDGGSHFHVWLMPRPSGMLEASGAMLPLWEDVLPNVPDEDLVRAAEKIAARLA